MKKYSGGNDPRLAIVSKRISDVGKVIVVMSPKGGVGKTVFSTITSLILAEHGYRTGLLDLDFTNPSTHIVLGINPLDYKLIEEKGVIPPVIHGVKYFTLALYIGDKPIPLRGVSVDNVFLEVLSIVRWNKLDFLVVDTPPSIRDEHLNILTYIGSKVEVVLITTPSLLAVKSIERIVELLRENNLRILGLVENMSSGEFLKQFCVENNIEYLGSILYDPFLDNNIGKLVDLKKTIVWKNIEKIVEKIRVD